MASYGSWVLLLALCIWSCSISTGEGAATGASEALFDSTRERLSTDPATESIEQTVGPGEAPGRRRRADARRRTHTPEKSTAEKANDERIAQQKAVETIKRAREEAIETAQRKEAVIAAEKKIRYDKARARIEASVAQVTRMQRKARQDLDEAKIAMEKRVQLEAQNKDARENEKHIVKKTKLLRSVLQEAEENVNDALKFCEAVKTGEGDAAYRKSFLAKEHREQGLGGPGGFARLTEDQFNIPWLTNLNDALSKAKLDTNYGNMVKVQKLLDVAEQNVESLQNKWSVQEEHRAQVNEALRRAAIQRELDEKTAAKREADEKKMAELKSKEVDRKAKLAALKARTEKLKEQAAELETKSLMAAAETPAPTPAPNATTAAETKASEQSSGEGKGKGSAKKKARKAAKTGGEENKGAGSDLGMARGHDAAIAEDLISDAEHSQAVAQRAQAKEHATKKQLNVEKAKVRQLEQNAHKSPPHTH